MDAGDEVLVADPGAGNYLSGHPGSSPGLLGIDVGDDETAQYFDALSEGVILQRHGGVRTCDRPIGVIEDLSPIPSNSTQLAPFVGSRLRDWAAGCLASPSGFLCSRVPERKAVNMRSSQGEMFEVAAIGSVDFSPDLVLTDWLSAQARERGIEVCIDSPLQRLVFEEGHVLGAVLDTPSGPCAVCARHGVLVSTGGHDIEAAMPCDLPENATLHVSVVRQAPSRFGRVALLTTQPLSEAPHTDCRPMNRHLADTARETRQSQSPNLRCGEMHRYPPLGK